jgi:hypothetical protein
MMDGQTTVPAWQVRASRDSTAISMLLLLLLLLRTGNSRMSRFAAALRFRDRILATTFRAVRDRMLATTLRIARRAIAHDGETARRGLLSIIATVGKHGRG